MRIGFDDDAGSSGPREQPPTKKVLRAVVACIEDAGMQEAYEADKPPQRKIVVGFELDWRDSKGRRRTIFKKYTKSLRPPGDAKFEQYSLRFLLDTLIPGRVSDLAAQKSPELDLSQWVGITCKVMTTAGSGGYTDIAAVIPAEDADGTLEVEGDYSRPFGLWAALLKSRLDK